jgi:hypothetical protein
MSSNVLLITNTIILYNIKCLVVKMCNYAVIALSDGKV